MSGLKYEDLPSFEDAKSTFRDLLNSEVTEVDQLLGRRMKVLGLSA